MDISFSDSSKFQIVKAKNLIEASAHKNKKTLLYLEDCTYDDGTVVVLAEKKKTCVLIDLYPLMHVKGVSRAILFAKVRKLLVGLIKHGMWYSFATFHKGGIEERSLDELENIGLLLGLNRGQVRFAQKMLDGYREI